MSDKSNDITDIFIVGGGVNGAGVARDAAGRGLSVTLVEMDDLAAHTSSASSKLIHGGLRYLEQFEFRLVRESLQEREILLNNAPHLIHPMRFVLPHHKALRPSPILRFGLFIYDYIGGRKILPPTNTRNLRKHPTGSPLKTKFKRGLEYSDCWVDDARLVCLTALDAAQRGAQIMVGHKMVGAKRENGTWQITTRNGANTQTHKAKVLVNAAGPWVDQIEDKTHPTPKSQKQVKMVKGSHIIVPSIYDGKHAFTFQNDDGRVVFTIPYQNKFTLIGTTDIPYDDDPAKVHIDDDERQYLCDTVSSYFEKPVHPLDILWAYSGVRPLVDDGAESASKTTRDYVLELDTTCNSPLLSIYGGKITTYRRLAEEVMEKLHPHLQFTQGAWTETAPLPGGEMGYAGFASFKNEMSEEYRWLPDGVLDRYAQAYGSNMAKLLSGASSQNDLGEYFGAGLYEAELTYMRDEEWAGKAEDALWRRSKLGLHLSDKESQAVANWFGG